MCGILLEQIFRSPVSWLLAVLWTDAKYNFKKSFSSLYNPQYASTIVFVQPSLQCNQYFIHRVIQNTYNRSTPLNIPLRVVFKTEASRLSSEISSHSIACIATFSLLALLLNSSPILTDDTLLLHSSASEDLHNTHSTFRLFYPVSNWHLFSFLFFSCSLLTKNILQETFNQDLYSFRELLFFVTAF